MPSDPRKKKLLDRAAADLEAIARSEPLTLDEQWKAVDDWYQLLSADTEEEFPLLDSFNAAWDELNVQYVIGGQPFMERGRGCGSADTPLATLFYYVEMGFYPPPELLLALLDTWQRYMGAGGDMDLESAFFGPSKKGAGNYAARRKRRFRLMWMRWEFDRMLREGLSRTHIAEELSNQLGGKPDADSILRMMRGFTGLFAKHQAEK